MMRAHRSAIADKIQCLRAFLGGRCPPEELGFHGPGDLLDGVAPARVLCLGKAARALARGAAARWPGLPGFLFEPSHGAPGSVPGGFRAAGGDHPVPGRASIEGTRALYAWLAGSRGPLLVLVSGGTSSLLADPPPPWTLAKVAALERALLDSGAPVCDVNAVRIRLSAARGGGLRSRAGAWPVFTGVWCDVAPGRWRLTGSAPMLAPGRLPLAEDVLARLGLAAAAPLPPRRAVRAGRGDGAACLADSFALAEAAAAWLRREGWDARRVPSREGAEAGEVVRGLLRRAAGARRPAAFVGSGEAPVRVAVRGRGGRCAHLACTAALALAGRPGWTFAALATDGVDGEAGGGAVLSAGSSPGPDALAAALARCDTAPLLSACGGLLPRRPTGNNLRDLWVLYME